MPPTPPNIVITKAREEDIPAIFELTKLAFVTDANTQVKEMLKGEAVFEKESHSSYLRSLLAHPRLEVLVARDTPVPEDAGLVVGAVIWGARNIDEIIEQPASVSGSQNLPPTPPPIPADRPLGVADLEALTSQSIKDWQEYFCPPNVGCRFVVGLAVRPDHQGRGIGGALLRWGTMKGDEDGVYCWVQASMGSKGAYEAAGFREVGRLELDLELFSGGRARPDGGKWGSYVWPYMRREPRQSASEKDSSDAGS